MKTAAKVFLIIGMVLGFYLIFPIVIGVITIKKINRARTVDELRGWGIASIFLVSTLGGIFTLCIRQYELQPIRSNYQNTVYLSQPKQEEIKKEPEDSLGYIKRIKELKELLDNGAITEEEFKELKAKELNN